MSYAQPGKRQKVREAKTAENVDYFQGIDKIEYNNMASATDTTNFRYYNSTERVHSRNMEDWLKYSVSLTEFRNNGSDSQGRPTLNRSWDDNSHTLDNYKRYIKAFYDFCTKLGIKYWTAFDTDLVPPTDNWEENKTNWDDIVECVNELNQRCQVKLLWIAPDLHSHPRYASGAFTSNEATTFVQAATQIKKCLEVSQRLNAECFLLWPYREGYDAIFQADVAREIKLFAKLLKITAEYKDRLNYRCQLLIMPYSGNFGSNYSSYNSVPWRHSSWGDMLNRYMWDLTSCLYFLKCHNLDRFYKVCTPPGHHMYMASVYNMFGGVTITNKFDLSDVKTITLMMKCIVDQGGAPPGGINLKLPSRRDSDLRDLVTMYVKCMDALAKGLRAACSVVTEQVFVKHLQQRYASYYSGFGSRLVSADVTIEECEEFYKKNQLHNEPTCSKPEHYHVVFQRYLDTCEHI
ncbi:xylose isomerase-like [Maniola hyperantus]|uniref:xylose isomerase-like n=1 Tax=Aphantopus hyperantus TaxID=2795564 RepID=UPI001569A8D2|nr:xylose isomerase-like [Maniola hyperantus]